MTIQQEKEMADILFKQLTEFGSLRRVSDLKVGEVEQMARAVMNNPSWAASLLDDITKLRQAAHARRQLVEVHRVLTAVRKLLTGDQCAESGVYTALSDLSEYDSEEPAAKPWAGHVEGDLINGQLPFKTVTVRLLFKGDMSDDAVLDTIPGVHEMAKEDTGFCEFAVLEQPRSISGPEAEELFEQDGLTYPGKVEKSDGGACDQ